MADDPTASFKQQVQDAAAQSSWAELLSGAEAMRDGWAGAITGLSAADSPSGAQDGPWSPWHLLNHVGAWLEGATNALDRATQGESTDLGSDQAFYPDSPSFEEARDRVARYVDTFVAQMEACGAGVGDDVRVTHRLLGEINAAEYAVLATGHVNGHTAQMREMRGLDG